jgi:hypothetical protein
MDLFLYNIVNLQFSAKLIFLKEKKGEAIYIMHRYVFAYDPYWIVLGWDMGDKFAPFVTP